MSSSSFPPVKPLRPAWQIALLAGLLSAAIATSGGCLLGVHPQESFRWQSWMLLGLAFGLAFAGATWAAAQWMSPSGRAAFWQPLAGLALACVGLAIGSVTGVFQPSFAAVCLSLGSMVACGTGVILMIVFRRTAPMMRERVAVAAGVLSGFAGFLAIQIHCPNTELWHMMLGHAALPVIWGAIAYLVTRLAFR